LVPPVDVQRVLEDYASVEECRLPTEADAITLRPKAGRSAAKVLVGLHTSDQRRRFTLAHELGHILIPWHAGTVFVSHVETDSASASHDYRAMEAEANRFAAELLMPTRWVRDRLGDSSLRDIYGRLGLADASRTVMSLQICQAAPPGWFFVEVDSAERVTTTARSGGTRVSLPKRGESLTLDALPNAAKEEIDGGSSKTIWWRFASVVPASASALSGEWRLILAAVLADSGLDVAAQDEAKKSISGIIGSANSGNASLHDLYTRCLQRISSDPALSSIARHALFPEFLSARLTEIVGRRA
jgi:hypothetical protein